MSCEEFFPYTFPFLYEARIFSSVSLSTTLRRTKVLKQPCLYDAFE